MSIELIAMCCSSALTVVSIVLYGITLHKKNKQTTTLEEAEKTKRVLEIMGQVTNLVYQAEHIFGKGNGLAKNQWVVSKTQLECVKQNVEISEKLIQEKIEEILKTPQAKEQKPQENIIIN